MIRRLGLTAAVLAAVVLAVNADHKPDPNVKIVTTDSGLKYQDLKVGTGTAAKEGDTVEVHYTGWLAKDGTKFDSSRDRKKTFKLKLGAGQNLKGWDEGLVRM